tara:strand:- start:1284 stop:3038 length:1755 start_codon:yes stop_codon:yes gene_type:complete
MLLRLTPALLCALFGASHLANADVLEVLGTPCQVLPSSQQVSIQPESDSVVGVTTAPGKDGYPGVRIGPGNGKTLDASAFSHLAATVRNTGAEPFTIHLRIDNPGDWRKSPWNVEKLRVEPGEAAVVRTFFGYQHGFKKGYALDPARISEIQLFTGKADETPISFRLESLSAAGTPGESPRLAEAILNTIEPQDGILYQAGVTDPNQVNITRSGEQFQVRPVEGQWNLRNYNQITVTLRDGTQVNVRAIDHGNRGTALMPSPVLFRRDEVWHGHIGKGASESHPVFDSRRVKAIEISGGPNGAEIESIIAGVHVFQRPDWFGKRPPIPGEWKLTLEDEFDQPAIDARTWNVAGPNYWGAKELTHWSRENVILKDGTASLCMEKKFGHHNDDTSQHTSPYTGGYLDTYDNWRQRYGYFEARMKLPTADGLWPAFWLMPDAGRELGPMWKRQKTEPHGMEFDILEHLTGWGPYRYHIAMHWDGYGKNHQSTGASSIYFSPDEDGFVTSGLLWEPGRAVYYVNGREIGRVESDRISDIPGMIIFTLPIGGWDNRPLNDAQLPAHFTIDYVRVWQRNDLASEADGHYE